MRLEITDACTGHGRCYDLMPELFVDDDAGYGQLKGGDGTVPPELADAARRALGICPERAIVLHEPEGAK